MLQHVSAATTNINNHVLGGVLSKEAGTYLHQIFSTKHDKDEGDL